MISVVTGSGQVETGMDKKEDSECGSKSFKYFEFNGFSTLN